MPRQLVAALSDNCAEKVYEGVLIGAKTRLECVFIEISLCGRMCHIARKLNGFVLMNFVRGCRRIGQVRSERRALRREAEKGPDSMYIYFLVGYKDLFKFRPWLSRTRRKPG